MKRFLQKSITTILALSFLLSMSGCGTGPAEQESTGEKTITVSAADLRNIAMLDATYAAGDQLIHQLVYEPLIVFGDGGKLEPGLAERWEISADGKEYTFYLRQGVKFSDGTDFNADSVLFSVARWEGASSTASLSVCQNLTNIEKVDDYTVKMTFSQSYYPYLIELSYPRPTRILGQNAVNPSGDVKGEFVQPIGTGRWMVESYDETTGVLVPNPHYYGEKPNIDKIVVKLMTDPQARLMSLQSGEVDFSLANVTSEAVPVIAAQEELDIFERPGTNSFYLMLNYDNPVLQDVNVRKAINYAVDKQSIVDNLLDGYGVAGKGILPDTNAYVTPENNLGYAYDREKALQLLKESGYEDSDGDGILDKEGSPLHISLTFQSTEYPDWKPLCESIQSQLKAIGIDLELKLLDVNAYYDAIWSTRDYDLIIYRTYADSWNPHGFLMSLFYQKEGEKAISWYDEQLNKLLDEVLASVDESKRQGIYDDIFKLMHEEAMSVPLYYPKNLYVYNKRLQNLEPAATSYEVLKWEHLDKK